MELFDLTRLINLAVLARRGYTSTVRTFAQNLIRIRNSQIPVVTQEILRVRLGHTSNSTVSKWEREDALPEPETIEKIAEALGVEPWELLEGVELPYDRLRKNAGDLLRHDVGVESGAGGTLRDDESPPATPISPETDAILENAVTLSERGHELIAAGQQTILAGQYIIALAADIIGRKTTVSRPQAPDVPENTGGDGGHLDPQHHRKRAK